MLIEEDLLILRHLTPDAPRSAKDLATLTPLGIPTLLVRLKALARGGYVLPFGLTFETTEDADTDYVLSDKGVAIIATAP